jgi:serine/threonine protein kinase
VYTNRDGTVTKRFALFSLHVMVRELHALRLMEGHPNVVQLVRVGETLQEYSMKHGGISLLKFCEKRGVVPLCEVKIIMHQLLQGLQAMHAVTLAHRDLKPDNVLIDEQGVLRICDFGASCHVYRGPGACEDGFENVMSCGAVCTSWYAPPEIINARAGKTVYNVLKLDIWSAGMICLEMLRGHPCAALRHDKSKKREQTPAEMDFRSIFKNDELRRTYGRLLNAKNTPFAGTLEAILAAPDWTDDDAFSAARGCGERQERLARIYLMFHFNAIRRQVLNHLTERYELDPLRAWVVDLLYDMLHFGPTDRPHALDLGRRHFMDCFSEPQLDWVNRHMVPRYGMLLCKDVPSVESVAEAHGVDVPTIHVYRINLAQICARIKTPNSTEPAWRILLRFLVGSGYRPSTMHSLYCVLLASVLVATVYWEDKTEELTRLPIGITVTETELRRTALKILENEDYQLETLCFGM